MKTLDVRQAQIESCVADAQQERVVLTRNGEPVALVIGLDEEQRQLGASDRFWPENKNKYRRNCYHPK